MKIVRIPFAVSLALLAVPAFAAAAPPKPPVDDGTARDEWRGQAIGVCVTAMGEPEGASADETEATCGCAVDRFVARQPAAQPPPLARGDVRVSLGGDLISCASEQRPALAASFVQRVTELPIGDAGQLASEAGAKPTETPATTPAAPRERSAPDFRTWLDSLSLPAWLTDSGLPVWAWGLLALLAFLVLRGLFRRDDRRHLLGPPPAMRRSIGPAPTAERSVPSIRRR